jgi:type IV pilus assembly protein PilX
MNTRQQTKMPREVQGTALIISMLLLVGIAVLGFAAMNSSTLQERIAGNERDRTTAFNAAESALRNAEDYLRKVAVLPVFDQSLNLGHYRAGQLPDMATAVATGAGNSTIKFDVTTESVWGTSEAITFMQTKGIVFGSSSVASLPAIPEVTTQPRYIIEEMLPANNRPLNYRITAAGWGRAGAVVVLQSYYTPPQATAGL